MIHFKDQWASVHRHEAQRQARDQLSCSKALTQPALELLVLHHDQAVTRAQALDKKHEGDGSPPGANPSTGAWRLINRIRGAAD